MTDRKPETRDKALPYYRWYVQDYRGSRNVQRLTWQEKGMYRELLDECWDKGWISTEIADLADIVGCTHAEMSVAWDRLERLFEVRDDGTAFSPRLEKERSAEDRARILKAIAGRRGGLAKASNARMLDGTAGKRLASSSEQLEQSKSSYPPAAATPEGAAAGGFVCFGCIRAEAGRIVRPEDHDEGCPHRPANPDQIRAIAESLSPRRALP